MPIGYRLSVEMDGKELDEILPVLVSAREAGHWVVLAGHDIGPPGRQTTRAAMLERLLAYAREPANGFWCAPVGTVAKYVRDQRGRSR